jgi:hypothetical protein
MYEVPPSEDLREFARKNNLTGSMAAQIVGLDSRTWRKWTANAESPSKRSIPWSAWILLRLYTGELPLEEYRAMATRPEAERA